MVELFWRIWTAVMLVSFAVLALFVLLATLQFESINAELTSDRLAVLADHTAEPFATPARIGLPLSTVRNAGALLERARQTDQQILSVHVYDSSGAIIQSTSAQRPDRLPPDAAAAVQRAQKGRWQVNRQGTFTSGINILGPTGNIVGGIMIDYPAAGHLTQVRAMAAELGFAALGGLIVVALASAALLRLTLGRLFRGLGQIEADIARFERSAWRSAAGASPSAPPAGASGLGALLTDAEARYRAIGLDLARLEAGKE